MKITLLQIALYALATFRLALMLSKEIGPARIFQSIRLLLKKEAKQNKALRKTALHEGIQCLWCDSVWVASIIAGLHLWLKDNLYFQTIILVLALSAISIAVNQTFTKD